MIDPLDNVKASLAATVWGGSLASLPRGRRGAVKALRIAHMLLRELTEGDLTLRAASLVFTSLLSLVPLLAVSFSLLKAFGVRGHLDLYLYSFLEPLGERGLDLANQVMTFVSKVNMGLLGGVGVLILFVTVMSLVQKVEAALNSSWRVRRTRNFAQRFSGYLSVLLVGPLILFTVVGLMGAIMGTPMVRSLADIEPFGSVLAVLPTLIPYALMIAGFSFIYCLMPNTRVRPSSAVVGGAVAGILWATSGWAFAAFVVNSPNSNYMAIYSSFAIVFFFMLWVYIAWLILLVGGTVAFYHQHPEYLGVMPGELRASNRLRERIALAAMVRVGRNHLRGAPPVEAHDLAASMRLPVMLVQDALGALMEDGFVVLAEEPAAGYLPGRDLGNIRLDAILKSARSAHELQQLVPDRLPRDEVVETLMGELEEGAAKVLGNRSLRSLLEDMDRDDSPGDAGSVSIKRA